VTYRAIYDQVHYAGFAAGDGERGFERNVRTMIKRMRRKFEAIDPDFQAIRSIVGLGYSWDGAEWAVSAGPAVDVAAAGP
jgi:two-component system response regulator ChvI